MERIFAMILAVALSASLTACGTSRQDSASGTEAAPQTPAASDSAASEQEETASSNQEAQDQGDTVHMIYYLDLKDGSIMAACYDDPGIQAMGEDYIKVYVEDAEITDADGNPMTLADMVRGCFMEVTFPGMVTMSIPAQISATKIVVTDNSDHGIPDESDIPDRGSGTWWQRDVLSDAPELNVQYKDALGQYTQMIPYRQSAWSYADESAQEGAASNLSLDGQTPQTWMFLENNTIKRTDFDTISLSFVAAPTAMTLTVYRQDDPADTGTVVPIGENGEITLMDASYNWAYVLSCQWNDEDNQGQAIYGFLVTAAN